MGNAVLDRYLIILLVTLLLTRVKVIPNECPNSRFPTKNRDSSHFDVLKCSFSKHAHTRFFGQESWLLAFLSDSMMAPRITAVLFDERFMAARHKEGYN